MKIPASATIVCGTFFQSEVALSSEIDNNPDCEISSREYRLYNVEFMYSNKTKGVLLCIDISLFTYPDA